MTDQANQTDVLSLSVREFIAAAAAKQPTPGGGSVAAAVGALGAALAEMSLAFTRGKKAFAEHEEFYAHLASRLSRAERMFADLVSDDIAAYGLYHQATAMEEGPAKADAVQLALAAAIAVPRESAKLALALLEDCLALADKCNPWLISDLAAAAALAVAVVRIADYNVRVNAMPLTDRAGATDVQAASTADRARAETLLEQIEQTVVRT